MGEVCFITMYWSLRPNEFDVPYRNLDLSSLLTRLNVKICYLELYDSHVINEMYVCMMNDIY